MIKAVFLDVDNTLLSFSEYVKETMRRGFSLFGLKPYTESMFPVFERINNHLWKKIEQGSLSFENLQKIRWNMVFDELDIKYDGEKFEQYFRDQLFYSAIPEPNAIDLLAYLSQRYTLCVASNGPYEQQINRLRVGKMKDYFSHFFISSRIGAQKPTASFFDYCFQELRSARSDNLVPEQTIIIGDSMSSDMAGGIGYGMHTCLYQKGPSSGIDLSHIDYIVSDLSQVKRFL